MLWYHNTVWVKLFFDLYMMPMCFYIDLTFILQKMPFIDINFKVK